MVLDNTRLLTFSTHFIVRSTMALSAFDSVSYQIPFFMALDLKSARLCLVNKQSFLSSLPH